MSRSYHHHALVLAEIHFPFQAGEPMRWQTGLAAQIRTFGFRKVQTADTKKPP